MTKFNTPTLEVEFNFSLELPFTAWKLALTFQNASYMIIARLFYINMEVA